MAMQTYDSIRGTIDTGDVFLFSGRGVMETAIKLFTLSKWSHVGMAVRVAGWDTLLIWEANLSVADVLKGSGNGGLSLSLLSERVRSYQGDVAVRRLLNINRTPARWQALCALRSEIRGRPYEQSLLKLIKSAYDGPFGHNDEDLSSVFCSELVAAALMAMGLLASDLPSSEYTPGDFSSAGQLNLLHGVVLGEEIVIAQQS